jgi:hypothetical protein
VAPAILPALFFWSYHIHVTSLLLAALWSFLSPLSNIRLSAERTTVQSDPLRVSVRLPEDWSVEEGQVLPAAPLRSACQIRTSLYVDNDWNAALAPLVRDAAGSRVLEKIGGHVAVEYRRRDGTASKELVFIDLQDVRQKTFAVWNLVSDSSAEGRQCQMSFGAMLQTIDVQ